MKFWSFPFLKPHCILYYLYYGIYHFLLLYNHLLLKTFFFPRWNLFENRMRVWFLFIYSPQLLIEYLAFPRYSNYQTCTPGDCILGLLIMETHENLFSLQFKRLFGLTLDLGSNSGSILNFTVWSWIGHLCHFPHLWNGNNMCPIQF